MKKTIQLYSLLSAWAVTGAFAWEPGVTASSVGTLPNQRKMVVLKEGDPNPFGSPLYDPSRDGFGLYPGDFGEIRAVLNSLECTGLRIGSGEQKSKALFGDLILEEGRIVPQLIENQDGELRCSKITEDRIELTLVDSTESYLPFKLILKVEMKRSVRTRLPGLAGVTIELPLVPKRSDRSGSE